MLNDILVVDESTLATVIGGKGGKNGRREKVGSCAGDILKGVLSGVGIGVAGGPGGMILGGNIGAIAGSAKCIGTLVGGGK